MQLWVEAFQQILLNPRQLRHNHIRRMNLGWLRERLGVQYPTPLSRRQTQLISNSFQTSTRIGKPTQVDTA